MKTLIKVSKSGKSITVNGNQISNFNSEGIKILPNFLEAFGTIEIECEISDFRESEQYKKIKNIYENQRENRALQNAKFAKKIAEERAIEDAKLQQMISEGNIPTTVENVRLVLAYLNQQNWGSWNLPKMTISYSAHQYDCDGCLATTIKLDKPISDENFGIENETMFKIGGKRGHLNKYRGL